MFNHLGSKGAGIGMDYTKLPNPYDFANPVMDPELFAGRTKEINDISYYLDHASRAARAINLAIMGERASIAQYSTV